MAIFWQVDLCSVYIIIYENGRFIGNVVFIHPFSRYLLSTHNLPGPRTSSEDTMVSENMGSLEKRNLVVIEERGLVKQERLLWGSEPQLLIEEHSSGSSMCKGHMAGGSRAH